MPARHELAVLPPYRLDLTVSALRRLATNPVDVLTRDGAYLRALPGASGPVIVCAAQLRPATLSVTIEGEVREPQRVLDLLRRILGIDRDVSQFERAAARIPWLSPLVTRVRGVKPPRYPTLWEALVNAILFQQVSLAAASAVARRLVRAYGCALEHEGVPLYTFPALEQVLAARDQDLRAMGISASKVATLRRAGEAVSSGALDEAALERQATPEVSLLLQRIKGIGPWTASVILLRGFGRLDVFPMNDASVARNLALVAGPAPLDVAGILDALRPQQGMLYYHLLLARLEARAEVGRPSVPPD